MKKIFTRPKSLLDVPTHYCAGCGHGIVHRLIAEIIDLLDVREKTIGIAPVGCAVLSYNYFDFDMSEAPHGRPPAVATGVKRVHPDKVVFAYQGDGDLAAIGLAEIIHTANKGENITVIFVNNGVYGMTNGQMAPTSIMSQKTVTTPQGRTSAEGYPLKICELLATLDGCSFLARVSTSTPDNIRLAKKTLIKGFKTQIENRGFALVEILSACPVYWRMDAPASMKYIDDKMVKTFPLGVFKDW
ncbi:MAG: thiamine pyrophosphate-dependent enzyme [Candidatus Anammoxibacter sp.]